MASVLDIIVRAVDQASGPARGIAGAMAGIATAATAAGAALATASVAAGAVAVKTAADFEQSLANTAAATGATKDQLASLRTEALAIGKDTSKSASESAEAMGELVRAGLSIEQVANGAARAVVQLAEATGSDVTDMAVLVSNSLNTFQKDGLKAAQVADIVAKAANASAIGTKDVSFALAAVGPVAAQAGLSMQDFATAVGILGNNALKGSDAGTSLKTMLMRLTAPTDEAKAILDRLNVSVFDAAGKTRGFRDILGDLQKSLAGASEEQKAATLTTLFGSDAIRAANILLGEGVEGWDAFTKTMADAPSVAEQSATRLNTLNGTIEQVKGTIETMAILIGERFLPTVRSIADASLKGLGFLLEADWSRMSFAFGIIAQNASAMMNAILPIFGDAPSALGPAIVGTVNEGALALAHFSGVVRDVFLQQVLPFITKAVTTVQKIFSGDWVQAYTDWIKPVQASMGNNLADIYQTVLGWLGKTLVTIIDQMGEWAGAYLDWVGPMVPVLIRQLGTFLDRMIGWFYLTALPSVVEQLAKWGGALVSWIVPRIPGMLVELAKLQLELNDWLVGRVPELKKLLSQWADRFLAWVNEEVMPKLPGLLDGVIKEIQRWASGNQKPMEDLGTQLGTAMMKGLYNSFRNIALPVPKFNLGMTDSGIPGVKIPSLGFGVSMLSLAGLIPALAEGGIVNKPTVALIGEAGPEAVVPLNRAGGMGFGGGQTIVLQFNAPIYGMSDFKAQVRAAMIDAQKRGMVSGLVAQT